MLEAQLCLGKRISVGLDSRFSMIPAEFRERAMRTEANEQRARLASGSLDGTFPWLPEPFRRLSAVDYSTMVEFNTEMVWKTRDYACAYMADPVFYDAIGPEGRLALEETVRRIHTIAPEVPFILSACHCGVEHSNLAMIEFAFDRLKADAITVNPYFGLDATQPLLNRKDKGIIVLCRSSNKGADEIQDMPLKNVHGQKLWQEVAWRIATYWNEKSRNCALLVGPMGRGELTELRAAVENLPIFVTGMGTQSKTGVINEDDVQEIITYGRNASGEGVVLCASRSVIFSPDPAREAKRLHKLCRKFAEQKVMV